MKRERGKDGWQGIEKRKKKDRIEKINALMTNQGFGTDITIRPTCGRVDT